MSTGFRDVAEQLRLELVDMPAGTRLPTQDALAGRFGVHRTTVADAIRELAAEGLVVTNRRGGTIRAYPPINLALPWRRYDWRTATTAPWEAALEHASTPERPVTGRGVVLGVSYTPATSTIGERLGVPADTPVVCRHRHMVVDGIGPAVVQRWWGVLERIRGTVLAEPVGFTGSTMKVLTDHGVALSWVREEITGRPVSREDATALGLRAGTVVLAGWRTTYDDQGPVAALQLTANPQIITMVYDMPLEATS